MNPDILNQHPEPQPPGLPDAFWRSMMTRGNEAFRAGKFGPALADYQNAVVEATRLLKLASSGVELESTSPAPALVVACGNAANAFTEISENEQAFAILREAIERLAAVISRPEAPLAVRMSCLENMNRASALLLDTMRACSCTDADIDAEFSAGRSTMERCIQALNQTQTN